MDRGDHGLQQDVSDMPGTDETRLRSNEHVAEIMFGGTFLTEKLAKSLASALEAIAETRARAVVLSNSGRAFAAGADIKPLRTGEVNEALRFNRVLIDLCDQVANFPIPIICCLNGMTFGGGLELALSCTVRVAAKEATFGFPEVKVGIIPGSGGLSRLPQLVSPGTAANLVLTGRTIDSLEAARLGLVDEVADGIPLVRGHEIATAMANGAPLAVRAALDILRQSVSVGHEATTVLVESHLQKLLKTNDADEGFAAFDERRDPNFTAS